MINDNHILSSILDIPVKPEPSFQVSHLDQNAGERFDRVFKSRVDFHQNETPPHTFEPKERPTTETETFKPQTPVTRDEPNPPVQAENQPRDPRPINSDSERRDPTPLQDDDTHSGEPKPAERINPFALPLERLAPNLNPVEALDNLLGTDLNTESSSAINTLKNLLTGLNIDSETIDQLLAALNNGDAAGLQNILTALRGLLQASNPVVSQIPVTELIPEVATNRLNSQEQQTLNLLVRAGLTQEEAQQVIQQIRGGTTSQTNTDPSAQLAKTAIDTIASKPGSENSSNSGNLQNGDSSGFSKHTSDTPRNFTGLAAERVESLASLIAPDKTGNVQTNPLIAKPALLPNLNASGQPAQGVLAEGTPATATATDAAAKAVDFSKPAITETYNGRASMDKPITAQIIEKFTLRGFGNNREVQIKLDPPSLGTIRMNVSTSGETVRATIVAENHVVKSVIENNLAQLKDSITHQGVKIDSFNVLVGGNASHSAEGHKSALDYLGQLGREGTNSPDPAEEILTLHRPVFLNENQSFSIFA